MARWPDSLRAPTQRLTDLLSPRNTRLRFVSGEIALDASQRPPDRSPLRFEVRTPLHTVVLLRTLVGVVIVDADRVRIACKRYGRGDFLVSSFDSRFH